MEAGSTIGRGRAGAQRVRWHGAGKTTFIKHLLGREYPGIHIGPEPTTDRFVVVMGGMEERRTPGNTLIVQPDKPYQVCRAPLSCHAEGRQIWSLH